MVTRCPYLGDFSKLLFRGTCIALCLLTCVAGTLGGESTPASIVRATDPAPLADALRRGSGGLAAGRLDDAIAAFSEAAKLERLDSRPHHGLALAQLAKGETGKAAAAIDQALTFSPKPDRALVLNAAACQLAARNRMRAIRLVREYLTANPKTIDEAMVNALGSALYTATPKERQNRLFIDAAAFYEVANKRLESARPGFKRYGAVWYSAAEADAKLAEFSQNLKKLDALGLAIDQAEGRVVAADKEIARQQYLMKHLDPLAPSMLEKAIADRTAGETAIKTAQKAHDDFAASMGRPAFSEKIDTVAMTAVNPPDLANAVDKTPPAAAETAVAPADPKTKPIVVAVAPPAPLVGPAADSATKPAQPVATPAANPAANPSTPNATPAPPRRRVIHQTVAVAVSHSLMIASTRGMEPDAILQLEFLDGQTYEATVVRRDDNLGLALIKVDGRRMACVNTASDFDGGDITCIWFPEADLFNLRPKALAGEAPAFPKEGAAWAIKLSAPPRLTTAPLFAGGKLVGMCQSATESGPGPMSAISGASIKALVGKDAADITPLGPKQDMAGALAHLVIMKPAPR